MVSVKFHGGHGLNTDHATQDPIYEELLQAFTPKDRIKVVRGHVLDIAKDKKQRILEAEHKERQDVTVAATTARIISNSQDEIKNNMQNESEALEIVPGVNGMIDFLSGSKQDLADEELMDSADDDED